MFVDTRHAGRRAPRLGSLLGLAGLRRAERSESLTSATVLSLAAITALAAVVRWPTLTGGSYWYDEWVTRKIVSGSLVHVFRGVWESESTPPLYYVVAWFWRHAFGTSEIGLRSLSALAGVATVPVVYSTAATLASRRAGLVAAALTAFSPLLVWYSTEARAYSLLVLFSALSLLFFARAMTNPERHTLALW